MTTRKKVFGIIPYLETEEGDRLTRESAERTVQIGMGCGALIVLGIILKVYPLMSQAFGQSIGAGFVVVMLGSWLFTSYMSYSTSVQKVVNIYKKRGQYYEGED